MFRSMIAVCDACTSPHFQFGWGLGWTMVDAFFWTTPTYTILGNIRDKKETCLQFATLFFGLVSKQQVDLPLSKPFPPFFWEPPGAFLGVEPGVVCHPIFASLLSYVAELEMEGAGIWWDGWTCVHGQSVMSQGIHHWRLDCNWWVVENT